MHEDRGQDSRVLLQETHISVLYCFYDELVHFNLKHLWFIISGGSSYISKPF